MRKPSAALCGALLAGLVACSQPLTVDNTNNPDIGRSLATPADLENFIGTTYVTAHQGTLGGSNDGLQTQMFVMGLENVSGLANFAMGPRGAVPRGPIDNVPNGSGDPGNLRDFTIEHRAARMATVGLFRLRTVNLGSPARNARARAFARFSLGVAFGNLALAYDSASILTENDDFSATIPLSGYQAVVAAALANLDSAIAIATAPAPAGPAADWFPLPATWINGKALTVAQFVQFARSYKAQFRANVARMPAERAAVDWAQVIADANAGITADFTITMNPTAGWDVSWVIQQYVSASWHQMSSFILGMADSSGAYDAWLSTPVANRTAFTVVTLDNRYPTGATRGAQQAVIVPGTFAGRPYWRNRPTGEDAPAPSFGVSQYDFYRGRAFQQASPSRTGDYPIMAAAEIRLLAAEGYWRTGDFVNMITRINTSRTAAGLPAIVTTITDTLTTVPGGASCVPRVPDIAFNFTKTKCGNVWDALKYEYRMETAYTGYGNWYLPGRGWGDLPEGTAFNWPVPNEELLVRRRPIYGLGGVGLPGGAARGSYGLFAGGAY
jgi:hypothetical protein